MKQLHPHNCIFLFYQQLGSIYEHRLFRAGKIQRDGMDVPVPEWDGGPLRVIRSGC